MEVINYNYLIRSPYYFSPRKGELYWLQSSVVASDGCRCICMGTPHCRGDIPVLEGTQVP